MGLTEVNLDAAQSWIGNIEQQRESEKTNHVNTARLSLLRKPSVSTPPCLNFRSHITWDDHVARTKRGEIHI